MTLSSEVQGVVETIQADDELNALRFRHSGTWSDGTSNRFSVKDPNRSDSGRGFTRLSTDPVPASLRLLKFWPGDPEPGIGASVAYQGGLLVVGVRGDTSIWTGQRVTICRLVDERAYSLTATIGNQGFRLRIEALDTTAMTGGQGADLGGTANDSHRAYLPPGVTLNPGELITTMDGDQYRVVPPVQRDSLGDTLGLSWMGRADQRTPSTGNDPTPTPTSSPQPAPASGYDPWWDESAP